MCLNLCPLVTLLLDAIIEHNLFFSYIFLYFSLIHVVPNNCNLICKNTKISKSVILLADQLGKSLGALLDLSLNQTQNYKNIEVEHSDFVKAVKKMLE